MGCEGQGVGLGVGCEGQGVGLDVWVCMILCARVRGERVCVGVLL